MVTQGQPDLFTKRTRKLPPAKEFEVHCMIADLLDRWLSPGWAWFHPANGEKRSKATAGRLKRMGVKPGVADFILVAPPRGRLHALELKRKGHRPSEAQERFQQAVWAAGGEAVWVDGFEAAVHVLKTWGAVRVSLS